MATGERCSADQRVAPHLRPILSAVREFGSGLLLCGQGAGPFAVPRRRPLICIVGDDTDRALGPAGFHRGSLRRLIRSADRGMLISSAPELQLYEAAALAAYLTGGTIIVVETRLEQEIPWLEFMQRASPGLPLIVSTVKGGTA